MYTYTTQKSPILMYMAVYAINYTDLIVMHM